LDDFHFWVCFLVWVMEFSKMSNWILIGLSVLSCVMCNLKWAFLGISKKK
jgi:hypothetical protein